MCVSKVDGGMIQNINIRILLLQNSVPVYSEIICLVDRSGSMSGNRINSVKDCLQLLLRSIPEGTLFNICGFGSSYESIFPHSLEYNESTLQLASQHVNSLTANMGGTEILEPLKSIFNYPPKDGIPRQLFILTDGSKFFSFRIFLEISISRGSLQRRRVH